MPKNHQEHYQGTVAIRHHLPGRVRIQVVGIGQSGRRAREVELALRALPGVYGVRSNRACDSIVIHHRRSKGPSRGEIALALAPLLAPLPSLPATSRAAASGRRRSAARETATDCTLCQLKLALARLILDDLWRCWRSDLENRALQGFLAEASQSIARRSALLSTTGWRDRLAATRQTLYRQVRRIIPVRAERLSALPFLPTAGPH